MNDTIRNAGAGDTVAVPRRALFLRDSTSEVQLAAPGDEQPRTFSMVALTGKPLAHWYFGTLAIDLAGVRMKQRLPVLKDHNTEERLGYTTAMRNEPGRGIVAEGRLLQRSPAAQQVLADSADGFPWQASTYLQASKMQRLAEGQSDQVNGYTVDGPATIFRESTLREVTFTALGVDDDTSATPLSATGADDEVAVLLTADTMQNQTPAEQAAPAAPAPAAADLSAQLAQATQSGLEAERARVLAICCRLPMRSTISRASSSRAARRWPMRRPRSTRTCAPSWRRPSCCRRAPPRLSLSATRRRSSRNPSTPLSLRSRKARRSGSRNGRPAPSCSRSSAATRRSGSPTSGTRPTCASSRSSTTPQRPTNQEH